MSLPSNFMCMVCGWRWHVAPKDEQKPSYRRCTTCGSSNTKADHEA